MTSATAAMRGHALRRNGSSRIAGEALMGGTDDANSMQPVLAAVDLFQHRVVEAIGRAVEHDASRSHPDYAVRKPLRELDVVHVDEHWNPARARDAGQELHDLDRSIGIERRRGLVV